MRRFVSSLVFARMIWLSSLGLVTLHAADEQPGPGAFATAPAVTTSPTPTTRLYVKTVPPGAHVTLDGTPLGPSDGLFIVPPGVSSVKVEFSGREPRVRQVEIAAGRITRLELDFAEEPAAMAAATPPVREAESTLWIDPAAPALSLPLPYEPEFAPPLPSVGSRGVVRRVIRIPSLTDVPAIEEIPRASDIDRALLRPLPDWVFHDQPLREVLDRIGKAAGVPISFDEPLVRQAGIDPESPVRARVGHVPLGSALSAIMRMKQLRWIPKGDGIQVTTPLADQVTIDRTYRITDLVHPSDPAGNGLAQFLSEASWPLESNPISAYRVLTVFAGVDKQRAADSPRSAAWLDRFMVRAEWWRQWRVARLLALLRQLRSTPMADRVPVSADGYWSDSETATEARAALDLPLETNLALDGLPLGEAIAVLSESAPAWIVIDSRELDGSPRIQQPVTLPRPTKGETLATVLEWILADVGLRFEVARDQLIVTPASWSAAAYYPVDDLLAAGHTFDSLVLRVLQGMNEAPRGRFAGEPPIWVFQGGVDCLAITHNTAGHRQVEKILRSLRARRSGSAERSDE